MPMLIKNVDRVDAGPAEEGVNIGSIFVSWLPVLVLVGVYIFFLRQMQSGTGRAMGFGKSQRAPADREARPRHLRGRRRHRRGQGRARGDRRLPEGPAEVPAPGRQDPQGLLAGRPAGHRQDAAGARHRRRGQRAVLHHLGLRLRRDVRRRRRQPRARHVRAGQEERALHRVHRRDRRRRPPSWRGPGRRQRRARADAEPAAGRDGRLRVQRRRHPDRRHQPSRRARSRAAAARAASTARSWCRTPTSAAARRSSRSICARCRWRRTSIRMCSRAARRASRAPISPTSSTRRRCAPRASASASSPWATSNTPRTR